VVATTHLDFAIDVSPDGSRLAFASSRNGRLGIWRADRDGLNQVLLASLSNEWVESPRWTPDGKSVIFQGGWEGTSAIYAVSADGGKPKRLTTSASAELRPSIAPDGKWLYYESGSSGRFEIWKQPMEGGTPVQVTRGGGAFGQVSADGKWVYYNREGALWRVPSTGGEEVRLLENIPKGYWTLAGNHVYFLKNEGERSSVIEYAPESGVSRIAYLFPFVIDPVYNASAIAVALKTGELFVQQKVRLDSDLVLVENFR
jgi:Tol biopolymer transport system component